jgi:manganese/iron transport system ATP-binding protein
MLSIVIELGVQGKKLLVCSHEWGETLNRYHRLLLLNRRVLVNDTPFTYDSFTHPAGCALLDHPD